MNYSLFNHTLSPKANTIPLLLLDSSLEDDDDLMDDLDEDWEENDWKVKVGTGRGGNRKKWLDDDDDDDELSEFEADEYWS